MATPAVLEATVEVTQTVFVTVDPAKFDEVFMEEFRQSFYQFDTLQEHLEHLGQMRARGLVYNGGFIEGYGPAEDMGISFREGPQENYVVALGEEQA